MSTTDAEILVPAAAAPQPGPAVVATAASFNKDTGDLHVTVKDGDPVTIPKGTPVFCNGVRNAPSKVPGWFDRHTYETVRVGLLNEKRLENGRSPASPVAPIYFETAEGPDGLAAQFNQR